jgi:hypothetical protein
MSILTSSIRQAESDLSAGRHTIILLRLVSKTGRKSPQVTAPRGGERRNRVDEKADREQMFLQEGLECTLPSAKALNTEDAKDTEDAEAHLF